MPERNGAVHTELDGGSYLAHYGIKNPWTLWLMRQAPELVALTPSELHHSDSAPKCRQCWSPMVPRDGAWRCYHHDPPVTRRTRLPVPDVRWVPGQPSALSLIGKDVDVAYMDDPITGEKGYVVVPFKEVAHD
jgi:hypothetical protein